MNRWLISLSELTIQNDDMIQFNWLLDCRCPNRTWNMKSLELQTFNYIIIVLIRRSVRFLSHKILKRLWCLFSNDLSPIGVLVFGFIDCGQLKHQIRIKKTFSLLLFGFVPALHCVFTWFACVQNINIKFNIIFPQ